MTTTNTATHARAFTAFGRVAQDTARFSSRDYTEAYEEVYWRLVDSYIDTLPRRDQSEAIEVAFGRAE